MNARSAIPHELVKRKAKSAKATIYSIESSHLPFAYHSFLNSERGCCRYSGGMKYWERRKSSRRMATTPAERPIIQSPEFANPKTYAAPNEMSAAPMNSHFSCVKSGNRPPNIAMIHTGSVGSTFRIAAVHITRMNESTKCDNGPMLLLLTEGLF